jgi:hypothetical protein
MDVIRRLPLLNREEGKCPCCSQKLVRKVTSVLLQNHEIKHEFNYCNNCKLFFAESGDAKLFRELAIDSRGLFFKKESKLFKYNVEKIRKYCYSAKEEELKLVPNESCIAWVELSENDGSRFEYWISLDKNVHTDISYEEEILYSNTPLSKKVLRAVNDDSDWFICNRISYRIIAFDWADENIKYDSHFRRIIPNREFKTRNQCGQVNIYKSTIKCELLRKDKHSDYIEDVAVEVRTSRDGKYQLIGMQLCNKCGTFNMSNESLKIEEDKYGHLQFMRILPETSDLIHNEFGFEFNEQSELSRYGYSANEKSPPAEERHKLLAWLIDDGLIEIHTIVHILSGFLHYRSEKCPYAKLKWQEDLEFVNNYKIGKRRRFRVD